MNVIRGLKNLNLFSQQTIVTIGNFDGNHLGHQKIIKIIVDKARTLDLFSMVMTFSPHPDKILNRSNIKMIQTLNQRLESFERSGIQGVLVIPFDQNLSSLSSKEFIQKILIDRLYMKEIVVGSNFRFGNNREGNIMTLKHFGKQYGFQTHEIPPVVKNNQTVSSSLIRKLLQE